MIGFLVQKLWKKDREKSRRANLLNKFEHLWLLIFISLTSLQIQVWHHWVWFSEPQQHSCFSTWIDHWKSYEWNHIMLYKKLVWNQPKLFFKCYLKTKHCNSFWVYSHFFWAEKMFHSYKVLAQGIIHSKLPSQNTKTQLKTFTNITAAHHSVNRTGLP